MAEIKVGDTVEVSLRGKVTYLNTSFADIKTDTGTTGTFGVPRSACTVVTPPLQVGDIITPENVHLLPEGFVVVDRDGAPWNDEPHAATLREYGPFKLVYIHGKQ